MYGSIPLWEYIWNETSICMKYFGVGLLQCIIYLFCYVMLIAHSMLMINAAVLKMELLFEALPWVHNHYSVRVDSWCKWYYIG